MLTLFSSPGSCSLASHIALAETGAPYTVKRVDFSRQEQQSPDYLKINPKGRVPALLTDQGVLTETPAILTFLAQSFPGSAIAAPADPFAFARIQALNAYLCSTVHVAHAHGRRGARWSDDGAAVDSMKLKVASNMGDCFALIEDGLLQGGWAVGAAYSIADAYLFTMASWLASDGVDIARFPKVLDHHTRMLARPAVAKALSESKAL